MENLKEKVNELVKEQGGFEQVKILQEINKELLTNYVIKISDECIVYPLHVEAYYYHQGKFEDKNVHGSKDDEAKKGQSNRFGKLYFHTIGRGGVDICLSRGDYCLSILIKASKIITKEESVFVKQIELYERLHRIVKNTEEEMLFPVKEEMRQSKRIFQTVRKGLKEETFKTEKLASLTELEIRYGHDFAFEVGYGRAQIVLEYMKKHPEEATQENIKEILDFLPKSMRIFWE
jgi:hypothetical protein